MKTKTIIILTLATLFIGATEALSSIRYEGYKQGPINVHVSVGRTTEVVFPELIAELMRSKIDGSLELEVKERSLYILPKNEVQSDVFVKTVGGQNIPINMIFKDPHDLRLSISYDTTEQNKKSTRKSRQKDISYTSSLMTALLLGKSIKGATVKELNKTFFKNKYIEVTLRKKYELNSGYALVAEVENLINIPIVVPIQHVSFKKLRAIAADDDVLAPNGEEGSRTKIYMVVEK